MNTLSETAHVTAELSKYGVPPVWRLIRYAKFADSPQWKIGIVEGEYAQLRSAVRASKRIGKKEEWIIEVENNGPGTQWIPWQNRQGRIEWPTSQ